MNGERSLLGRSLFKDALAVVIALVVLGGVLCAASFGYFSCAKLNSGRRITGISESLKEYIKENCGIAIPDHAKLIEGKRVGIREVWTLLAFEVEPEKLPGYEKTMNAEQVVKLMSDGSLAASYPPDRIDAVEEYMARSGREFTHCIGTEKDAFTTVFFTDIEDGILTVFLCVH